MPNINTASKQSTSITPNNPIKTPSNIAISNSTEQLQTLHLAPMEITSSCFLSDQKDDITAADSSPEKQIEKVVLALQENVTCVDTTKSILLNKVMFSQADGLTIEKMHNGKRVKFTLLKELYSNLYTLVPQDQTITKDNTLYFISQHGRLEQSAIQTDDKVKESATKKRPREESEEESPTNSADDVNQPRVNTPDPEQASSLYITKKQKTEYLDAFISDEAYWQKKVNKEAKNSHYKLIYKQAHLSLITERIAIKKIESKIDTLFSYHQKNLQTNKNDVTTEHIRQLKIQLQQSLEHFTFASNARIMAISNAKSAEKNGDASLLNAAQSESMLEKLKVLTIKKDSLIRTEKVMHQKIANRLQTALHLSTIMKLWKAGVPMQQMLNSVDSPIKLPSDSEMIDQSLEIEQTYEEKQEYWKEKINTRNLNIKARSMYWQKHDMYTESFFIKHKCALAINEMYNISNKDDKINRKPLDTSILKANLAAKIKQLINKDLEIKRCEQIGISEIHLTSPIQPEEFAKITTEAQTSGFKRKYMIRKMKIPEEMQYNVLAAKIMLQKIIDLIKAGTPIEESIDITIIQPQMLIPAPDPKAISPLNPIQFSVERVSRDLAANEKTTKDKAIKYPSANRPKSASRTTVDIQMSAGKHRAAQLKQQQDMLFREIFENQMKVDTVSEAALNTTIEELERNLNQAPPIKSLPDEPHKEDIPYPHDSVGSSLFFDINDRGFNQEVERVNEEKNMAREQQQNPILTIQDRQKAKEKTSDKT